MKKILISGYYGFNNIGDESVLRTLIHSLRTKLDDIEITVLSQNPADTAEKYSVISRNRMSIPAIFRSIRECDLLISGGGSLLQDATTKRSILYYLFIIRLALLFGKKVFIYSQGIGPINSAFNRRLTAACLKKTHGIVVRDELSKRLLCEIGVPEERICVTSDPVIRLEKASKAKGLELLAEEGCALEPGRLTIGWVIKDRGTGSAFAREIKKCVEWLSDEYGADSVLIPFHYEQDLSVAEAISEQMDGRARHLRKKHLSDDMLSIIGNMDLLVGVRLHSLIYAAVMGVPMIGISYDPKIDSFMASVGLSPMSSVAGFTLEAFKTAFAQTMSDRQAQLETVENALSELVSKLDRNEELIKQILSGE